MILDRTNNQKVKSITVCVSPADQSTCIENGIHLTGKLNLLYLRHKGIAHDFTIEIH